MSLKRYTDAIRRELYTPLLARELAVELVSTFMLVSVQCAVVLSWSKDNVGTSVQVGLAMAFVVCNTIWSMGEFGLVHMNPALSLAFVLAGKMTLPRGLIYSVVQCVGATAGAAFIFAMTPASHRATLAATELNSELAPWQGLLIEIWLTFIFIMTTLGSIDDQRKPNLFMHTLPIGLSVGVVVFSGAQYTGASINPARSLGPAIMMNIWEHHWIYWAGPLCGATLATFFYYIVFDLADSPRRMRKKVQRSMNSLDVDEKSGIMESMEDIAVKKNGYDRD